MNIDQICQTQYVNFENETKNSKLKFLLLNTDYVYTTDCHIYCLLSHDGSQPRAAL